MAFTVNHFSEIFCHCSDNISVSEMRGYNNAAMIFCTVSVRMKRKREESVIVNVNASLYIHPALSFLGIMILEHDLIF